MKDLLCEFADRFPNLAAEILYRDRHKRRNFREETITDVLMAGLIGLEPLGISVDFPVDESKTGEDMDWEFVDPKALDGRRYLRLHIQAKRAIQSKAKSPYWFYRELDHAVPKGAPWGSQHEMLLTNADPTAGCLPLYMFYHSRDAVAPASAGLPAIEGVNVMFADRISVNLSKGRWSVADKKVEKWRPHFMPLSKLLCFGHLPAYVGEGPDWTLFFLVRGGPGGGLISPGELEDRLNALRAEGEMDFAPVRSSEEIPERTLRALEGDHSKKRFADIDRPRVIFNSQADWDRSVSRSL